MLDSVLVKVHHILCVDTRGDFAPKKIGQLADDDFELLDRIILITALTVELLEEAVCYVKTELLSSHRIPLVIVDNISVPFRTLSIDDIGSRIAAIRKIGLALRELLLQPLTLLIVNHMTTRFINEETSRLVPALGENWAAITDLRLLLEERSTTRAMVILRSDLEDFGQKELLFRINSKGLDFSLR